MGKRKENNGHDPLEWITNYEEYLLATRIPVLNGRAREIMVRDAESKEAAVKALKRFGFLDADGNVTEPYR